MTTTSSGVVLQQVMMIAERCARGLVAAGPPSCLLVIERAGSLEFVPLAGQDTDVAKRVRSLLVEQQATSAALLIEVQASTPATTGSVFCILGETLEGASEERSYRVRSCGRQRRLTVLGTGVDATLAGAFRPLFPVHLRPQPADAVPVDLPTAVAPSGSGDVGAQSTTVDRTAAA